MADSWNSPSWAPPDISQLTFNDCSTGSTLLAGVTRLAGDTGNGMNYIDFPFVSMGSCILVMLGNANQSATGAELRASASDTIAWMYNFLSNDSSEVKQYADSVFFKVRDFTLDKCKDTLCPELGWQGNQDLAGRGMLVNYFAQAGLVTIYFIVLGAARLGRLSRFTRVDNEYGHTWPRRAVDSVQESFRTFLDAAVLFCIVMLIGAIYNFSGEVGSQTKAPTLYANLTAGLMALFSIFPALLLYVCGHEHVRRSRTRRATWALIFVLTFVMVILYYCTPHWPWDVQIDLQSSSGGIFSDPDHQLTFEMNCLDISALFWFTVTISAVVLLMASVIVVWLLLIVNILRLGWLQNSKALGRLRRNWWLVTGAMCFVAMWFILSVFMVLRYKLGANAGNTDKDQEWTFGQVLAVGTWLPVVAEVAFIFKDGAVKGLNGQISDRFEVRRVDTADQKETMLADSKEVD